MSYVVGEASIEILPPESNDLKRFQFLACDDMCNTLGMVRNLCPGAGMFPVVNAKTLCD